jgi:phosphatidylinositol alpha-mannosyltransferase
VLRVSGGARLTSTRATWSSTPTVVFAGRAQVGRGVDDLIEAFAIVREHLPAARLVLLLLPGAAAQTWQRRLASEAWATVRVGAIDDLDAEFATCQAAAFPFRWSTTLTPALAAAEAMATGLPLVATTVDCLAPLVEHRVNGALVPPCDPTALGHALVRVLQERETWEQLSESARKTIESRWSWSAAAEATRDAYTLAIGRSR